MQYIWKGNCNPIQSFLAVHWAMITFIVEFSQKEFILCLCGVVVIVMGNDELPAPVSAIFGQRRYVWNNSHVVKVYVANFIHVGMLEAWVYCIINFNDKK